MARSLEYNLVTLELPETERHGVAQAEVIDLQKFIGVDMQLLQSLYNGLENFLYVIGQRQNWIEMYRLCWRILTSPPTKAVVRISSMALLG